MRQALSAFLFHHGTSCLKESEFIIAVTSDMLIFWMYEFCMRSLMVPACQAAQSICKVINRHNFIQGFFILSPVFEKVRNFVYSTTASSGNTKNSFVLQLLFCRCVISTLQRSCLHSTFLHLCLSTRD